tara:strand:+ start:7205 stop:8410 length:1206 start_codon:yes stop_codon:yes gene_type:complete
MTLLKNSALSSKNFRLYFCGNIFSVLGVWIQRLSLGWHAWQLSESAFIVGLAAAVQYIPLLFLTPFFGVLADQYKPRSSAIVMHLILIFVALSLSVLTLINQMEIVSLLFLSFLYGVANSAYSPIRLALIPSLVSAKQLSSGVAISSAGFNLSRFIGPGIAGYIVTVYGLGYAYLVNAITYIPVVAVLAFIKTKEIKEISNKKEGFFEKLKKGMIYTFNHDVIKNVILIAGVSSFFGRGLIELLPVFTATVYDGGSETLAILMAASGLGAVLASLIYMSGVLDLKLSKAVFYGGFGMSIMCLFFALTENLIIGSLMVMMIGFFITFVAVGSQSEVQLNVANELRGRVSSLWTIVVLGGPAVGSLFAGVLANELGPKLTAMIFSSICLVILSFIAMKKVGQN